MFIATIVLHSGLTPFYRRLPNMQADVAACAACYAPFGPPSSACSWWVASFLSSGKRWHSQEPLTILQFALSPHHPLWYAMPHSTLHLWRLVRCCWQKAVSCCPANICYSFLENFTTKQFDLNLMRWERLNIFCSRQYAPSRQKWVLRMILTADQDS